MKDDQYVSSNGDTLLVDNTLNVPYHARDSVRLLFQFKVRNFIPLFQFEAHLVGNLTMLRPVHRYFSMTATPIAVVAGHLWRVTATDPGGQAAPRCGRGWGPRRWFGAAHPRRWGPSTALVSGAAPERPRHPPPTTHPTRVGRLQRPRSGVCLQWWTGGCREGGSAHAPK